MRSSKAHTGHNYTNLVKSNPDTTASVEGRLDDSEKVTQVCSSDYSGYKSSHNSIESDQERDRKLEVSMNEIDLQLEMPGNLDEDDSVDASFVSHHPIRNLIDTFEKHNSKAYIDINTDHKQVQLRVQGQSNILHSPEDSGKNLDMGKQSPNGVDQFQENEEKGDVCKRPILESCIVHDCQEDSSLFLHAKEIEIPHFHLHSSLQLKLSQHLINRCSMYSVIHDVNKEVQSMASHDKHQIETEEDGLCPLVVAVNGPPDCSKCMDKAKDVKLAILDEEKFILSAIVSRNVEESNSIRSCPPSFAEAIGEIEPRSYNVQVHTNGQTANPLSVLAVSRTQLWKPNRSWWEAKSGKNPWIEPESHNKRWRYLWPLIHYHKFLAKCIKKLKRNNIDVKTCISPVSAFLREEVCAVSDHLASASKFDSETWMAALSNFNGWVDQEVKAESRMRQLIKEIPLRSLREPLDMESSLLRSQVDKSFLKAMANVKELMVNGASQKIKGTDTSDEKEVQLKSSQDRLTLNQHNRDDNGNSLPKYKLMNKVGSGYMFNENEFEKKHSYTEKNPSKEIQGNLYAFKDNLEASCDMSRCTSDWSYHVNPVQVNPNENCNDFLPQQSWIPPYNFYDMNFNANNIIPPRTSVYVHGHNPNSDATLQYNRHVPHIMNSINEVQHLEWVGHHLDHDLHEWNHEMQYYQQNSFYNPHFYGGNQHFIPHDFMHTSMSHSPDHSMDVFLPFEQTTAFQDTSYDDSKKFKKDKLMTGSHGEMVSVVTPSKNNTPACNAPQSPYWDHLDHTTLAMSGVVTPMGHHQTLESTPVNKTNNSNKKQIQSGASSCKRRGKHKSSKKVKPLLVNPYLCYYQSGNGIVPPSPATQFLMSPQSNNPQAHAYYTNNHFNPHEPTPICNNERNIVEDPILEDNMNVTDNISGSIASETRQEASSQSLTSNNESSDSSTSTLGDISVKNESNKP
eukprot:CAMPEP_0184867180 /NCGR_PEP_ID=MMETSP0580-20130426/25305_1 /TAXON_ID=1118495 /ORGANISM="Dactyliosolen fragilissimus" /LENGTH=961 /DNA_ID=CAMNT_0027367273 /DNA_START=342 /DNA_END=3227 /DNA_ORIENTATION=+